MTQPKKQTEAEYQIAYQRARNERLNSENRCRKCEMKLKAADRPRVHCSDCREYFADRAKARREGSVAFRHVLPSERLTPAEKTAQRRAGAKAKGLCGTCTLRKPAKGFRTCDHCRALAAETYEARKT